MTVLGSVAEVASLVRAAASPDYRIVVGIAGAPGAGKSTVAADLVQQLGASAVLVPMDGFHLPQAELVRRGSRDRMGAPDTFDVDQFFATLVAIRRSFASPQVENSGQSIRVPGFDRVAEAPVPDAIDISPEFSTVIVEGNYLLLDDGAWARVAPLLDLTFFVELDRETRLDRLVARHVEFGKSEADAVAWAHGPDKANAVLIERTAARADHRIRLR